MLYKILLFLVSVKSAFCGCRNDVRQHGFSSGKKVYAITKKTDLPKILNESSALVKHNENFISLNDSGGKNELYEFDTKGVLQNTYLIDNQTNKDWEALASDQKETVFIGDMGNNCNCRKDLTIYKYNLKTKQNEGEITFIYPDQTAFPPVKKERHFDCEAMLYFQDSLYLFSKNRGEKMVRLYVLPAKSGNYVAVLKDKIRINSAVTDATLNTDASTFALITYGKVLLFDIENKQIDFQSPKYCRKTSRKMTEAIAFKNETDFYFTNEQGQLFFSEKQFFSEKLKTKSEK